MVDAADLEKLDASRNELHNLLEKPQLQGIPVCSFSSGTPDLFGFLKPVCNPDVRTHANTVTVVGWLSSIDRYEKLGSPCAT